MLLFIKIMTKILFIYLFDKNSLRNIPTRHKQRNIIPVQKDLIQFGYAPSFRCIFILCHIFQQHIHKIIESQQRSHHFLVVFHDNVYSRADAFVHEL